MNDKTRNIGTLVLAWVNPAIGFYAGFAYIALTANAAIESGAMRDIMPMCGGGVVGGFSRCLAVSIVAFLLHALPAKVSCR